MATEYKLSYTASQINEKLGKIDGLVTDVESLLADGGTVDETALILSSPNGTRFKITIGDDGILTASEITE